MSRFFINGKFLTQRITGVQRYAYEITSRLTQLSEDGAVIIPAIESIQEQYPVTFPTKAIGGKGSVYWEQVRLPAYLMSHRSPLLINLCNIAPVLYSNHIFCIHDLGYLKYPAFFSRPFYYYYKTVVPTLIKSSRHIITVSECSKEDIVRHFKIKPSKISVIPNGVSDRFIGNSPDCLVNPFDRPYFLFVGSRDPRKNLLFLLEAYTRAKITETALVIVGGQSKSFNDELQNKIDRFRNNTNIFFEGSVSDTRLACLYRHTAGLIVPSLYEGFGLPIIEGLANGCRVYASDIAVFREVGGHQVKYFNLENSSQLVELLETADANSTKCVNSPDQTIISKFNWNKSAYELHNIIQKFT